MIPAGKGPVAQAIFLGLNPYVFCGFRVAKTPSRWEDRAPLIALSDQNGVEAVASGPILQGQPLVVFSDPQDDNPRLHSGSLCLPR